MKEKRYFCESGFVEKIMNHDFFKTCILLAIGIIFFSIIGYNMISKIYSNKINNSYSEEDFSYIYEIAEEVIDENGINLSKIPERVSKYEIIYEDDEIKFKYYLKSNFNNLNWAEEKDPLSATIILSKEFEVLDKYTSFSSMEEYVKYEMNYYKILGILFSITIFLLFTLIFLAITSLGYLISEKNKEKSKKIVAFRPKNVSEHFDDPDESETTFDYYCDDETTQNYDYSNDTDTDDEE